MSLISIAPLPVLIPSQYSLKSIKELHLTGLPIIILINSSESIIGFLLWNGSISAHKPEDIIKEERQLLSIKRSIAISVILVENLIDVLTEGVIGNAH